MYGADQVSAPTKENTRSRAVTSGSVTTIDLATLFGTYREYNHEGYYTLIADVDIYVLCGSETPVVIDEVNHDDDGDEPFLWPADTPMPIVVRDHTRYLGVQPTADGTVRIKRG